MDTNGIDQPRDIRYAKVRENKESPLPIRKPALVPSESMFMCCWEAYTTASSCSEDSHPSSITLGGSLRSNHTWGGSTLERELEGGEQDVM